MTRLQDRLNAAVGTGRSGSVSLTTKGRIDIDLSRAVTLVAEAALTEVRRTTQAGKDIDGKPFAAYSPTYRAALAKAGEGTNVDLWLTGGMMAGLKELRRKIIDGAVAELVIGLGSTRSDQRMLTNGKASRAGGSGPEHSKVGMWLNDGTATMPPRRWLGLSPQSRARLKKLIERMPVFRQR